jgi:ribosomal protein S18 acetylase RimI-like enzyme
MWNGVNALTASELTESAACFMTGNLRLAKADDAEAMLSLLRESFGEALRYTAFRSERSLPHLRMLINGSNPGGLFVVADMGGELHGFFNAVLREGSLFLNYISVSAEARGQGVGSALLHCFHQLGQARRVSGYQLDVFERNRRAVAWYLSHGYEDCLRGVHVAMQPADIAARGQNRLKVSPEAWRAGLAHESLAGVSRVAGMVGNARVTIGLLGGDAAKLLTCIGAAPEDVLPAVADFVKGERAELLATFPTAPPTWPLRATEPFSRMAKPA